MLDSGAEKWGGPLPMYFENVFQVLNRKKNQEKTACLPMLTDVL